MPKKKPGRFVVYMTTKSGRGYHTLARFHKKEAATKLAEVESIARKGAVYVDEILGRNKGEPIATYSNGFRVRVW